MKPLFLIGVAACLFASGCDDSKNPLSDPQTSKADERLAGVWLDRGSDGDVYFHVGHAGDKFPASMMRVVGIKHRKGMWRPAEEYLVFPTFIGDKTYLNVIFGRDVSSSKAWTRKAGRPMKWATTRSRSTSSIATSW